MTKLEHATTFCAGILRPLTDHSRCANYYAAALFLLLAAGIDLLDNTINYLDDHLFHVSPAVPMCLTQTQMYMYITW